MNSSPDICKLFMWTSCGPRPAYFGFMGKLSIFSGNSPVKQIEGELERTENDIFERKTIRGRFVDSKENLLGLLGLFETGELGLAIDGRSYVVKNLLSDGTFDAEAAEAWQQAMAVQDSTLGLPSGFYEEELERIVLAQGVSTRDEYRIAKRTGRGIVLNRSKRDAIWPVFEEYPRS